MHKATQWQIDNLNAVLGQAKECSTDGKAYSFTDAFVQLAALGGT